MIELVFRKKIIQITFYQNSNSLVKIKIEPKLDYSIFRHIFIKKVSKTKQKHWKSNL